MNPRTARIEIHLTPQEKDLIGQAAALSGQTIRSFALATLLERAHALATESYIIKLTQRESVRFLDILEADDEPAPALKAAAQRYLKGRG